MASKNAQIDKVFRKALLDWSRRENISVAWSGKGFDPSALQKYVSESLLPSRPQNIAIGRGVSQRFTGVYQIDVYSCGENAKYDSDVIVESLESEFLIGYPKTYNGVSLEVENFYADPLGLDEGWYRVSISIFYRTDI